MTIRINGRVVRVRGPADVFNWSNEELRKYNPFAPRSDTWYDFGSMQGARPDEEANAVFDDQLLADLSEAGVIGDDDA